MTNARMAAVELLEQVLDKKAGLEEAIASHPTYAKLMDRDRNFARALVMLVMRRLGQIDALLAGFMSKPLPSKMARVHNILRLGVAQLVWLDTPAHAAVFETVELASLSKFVSHKKLVNAILQRTSREGKAAAKAQDEAKLAVPGWLWDSWVTAYGEPTARAIATAQLKEPALDITLKTESAQWAARLGGVALPTGSIRVTSSGPIPAIPGFAQGEWWVQDAAAALPVRLLGNVSGTTVIDFCAAPGGKTAQLAAAGANVIAIDLSERRLAIARQNLQRLHLSSVEWITGDAGAYQPGKPINHIVLDAPCSATGTIRRHPDVMHHRTASDIERLVVTQHALLTHAAGLLPKGGKLIYVVCSLQPEEGERQIAAFLKARSDVKLVPITPEEVGNQSQFITTDGYLRTLPSHWPEHGGLDGFFAARLEKI